ncbi:lipopolysaccharide biosynthesis protein [Sphingomonas faeni]|uniref:lipopolysaccharide biosynthesis protein n=1 Tax=Sphingomonas faeni TaxID=185950 RepID=UPI00277DF65B|nr:lipopolysaccharide biosynthesis protein [Sphingomonas faeni]MDQ0839826.1 teichuronic acid exporter [Sphingomonas faeni]
MRQNKTVSAGIWSGLDLSARFIIQFIVSIVLARILSPAEFGIYALTLIFVALSQVLVDGGFSTAIIQAEEISDEEMTSVFWYNLIISIILSAFIAMVAPAVARLFGYPILTPLLYGTAVIVPFSALATVPAAKIQRELRFDRVAKAGLSASIISGVIAVVAAMNGAGIWSFTFQAAAYAVVNTGLIWLLAGWRPLRSPHLRAARRLASFGSLVALSGLLDVVYVQGSTLIIGKLYGAKELGFYNRAQNLQSLPASILSAIVTRVALPIFSSKFNDKTALRRGTRLAQGVVMLINLPLMAMLATVPDLIINVLYGAKWLPAAPILTILAIGGVLFPLHAVNLQLILSQGRSDLYLKVEIAKKFIGVLFLGIGSFFGVTGLALGQTAFVFLAFFLNAGVAGRMIDYRPFRQLRDLGGTIAITLLMAGIVLLVRPLLPFGNFWKLVTLSIIAGVSFAGTAFLLRIGATYELLQMTPLGRFLKQPEGG